MTEKELVEILQKASYDYYTDGTSELSDLEYDTLEQELRKINPNNPFLSEIGSEVRGGKINLPDPMGSLDQLFEGDLQKWIVSNNWKDELFVISNKYDGNSGINYHGKRGQFNIAYSRGNGLQGADITRHVSKFVKLSKGIQAPAAIRCEYILTKENYNKIKEQFPEEDFKNSRNYASGRMNATTSPDIFYQYMDCVATALVSPKLDKIDQIKFLQEANYIVPEYIVAKGSELTDEFLKEHLAKQKITCPYEIDGLVIDVNNLKIRESLTRNSSSLNPTYSRKFKIGASDESAITKVVKVHWEASKHLMLKPRIEIEPVHLDGVTIRFASGYNAKNIRELGIGPGAEVLVIRAGLVIPRVEKVLIPTKPDLPDPEIYGEWYWNDSEVDILLKEENDIVRINRLIAIFKDLNVDHLGEGNIVKLYENFGKLDATDIIKLTEEQLVSVIGVNGSVIFNSLKSNLNPITMANLAGSSHCFPKGIGRRKFAKLFETYPNFKFENINDYDLTAVEGFSDITAECVIAGAPQFIKFLTAIEGYYTVEQLVKSTQTKLADKSFVFTGYRDKDAEEKIQSLGGDVKSSISRAITYLVTKDADSTSGKIQKARDLGIQILTPDQLNNILN